MPTFTDDAIKLLNEIEAIAQQNEYDFGAAFAPIKPADLMRKLEYPSTDEPTLTLTDILEQLKPLERAFCSSIKGEEEKEQLWSEYKAAQKIWEDSLPIRDMENQESYGEQCGEDWRAAYNALFDTLTAEQMALANAIDKCWQQEYEVEFSRAFDTFPQQEGGSKILSIPRQKDARSISESLVVDALISLGIAQDLNAPSDDDNTKITFYYLDDELLIIAPDDGGDGPHIDFAAVRKKLQGMGQQMASTRWKKIHGREGDIYEHEYTNQDDSWIKAAYIYHNTNPSEDEINSPLPKHFKQGVYIDGEFVDINEKVMRIGDEVFREYEDEAPQVEDADEIAERRRI